MGQPHQLAPRSGRGRALDAGSLGQGGDPSKRFAPDDQPAAPAKAGYREAGQTDDEEKKSDPAPPAMKWPASDRTDEARALPHGGAVRTARRARVPLRPM